MVQIPEGRRIGTDETAGLPPPPPPPQPPPEPLSALSLEQDGITTITLTLHGAVTLGTLILYPLTCFVSKMLAVEGTLCVHVHPLAVAVAIVAHVITLRGFVLESVMRVVFGSLLTAAVGALAAPGHNLCSWTATLQHDHVDPSESLVAARVAAQLLTFSSWTGLATVAFCSFWHTIVMSGWPKSSVDMTTAGLVYEIVVVPLCVVLISVVAASAIVGQQVGGDVSRHAFACLIKRINDFDVEVVRLLASAQGALTLIVGSALSGMIISMQAFYSSHPWTRTRARRH